jgi:hypothetical protein
VGLFACRAAPLARRVICYEATARNFKRLERNVAGLENVVAVREAVSGLGGPCASTGPTGRAGAAVLPCIRPRALPGPGGSRRWSRPPSTPSSGATPSPAATCSSSTWRGRSTRSCTRRARRRWIGSRPSGRVPRRRAGVSRDPHRRPGRLPALPRFRRRGPSAWDEPGSGPVLRRADGCGGARRRRAAPARPTASRSPLPVSGRCHTSTGSPATG